MFLAVPDEENSSAGMRGTIRKLNSFIKEKKLDVIAAFTGNLVSGPLPMHQANHSVPITPVRRAKSCLSFTVSGRPHTSTITFKASARFFWLPEIVTKMEANPAFLEGQGNWLLSPPACLGFEIRRNGYSVTLPERAVCYFNLLTIEKLLKKSYPCAWGLHKMPQVQL